MSVLEGWQFRNIHGNARNVMAWPIVFVVAAVMLAEASNG